MSPKPKNTAGITRQYRKDLLNEAKEYFYLSEIGPKNFQNFTQNARNALFDINKAEKESFSSNKAIPQKMVDELLKNAKLAIDDLQEKQTLFSFSGKCSDEQTQALQTYKDDLQKFVDDNQPSSPRPK